MGKFALIVIDMQKGFDEPYWGKRNNLNAEKNIEEIITRFRNNDLEVIHVKHNSLEEKSPLRVNYEGNDYKKEAIPQEGEKEFSKNVNSAFIGTNLENYLKSKSISSLVIVGLTTDHCVSTTTRMAGNLGFEVRLISDATATFDRLSFDGVLYSAEQMHRINLASLNGEFCTVLDTKELFSELKI